MWSKQYGIIENNQQICGRVLDPEIDASISEYCT